MDTESRILPILKRLINKSNGESLSDICKNIKSSMKGQALIEFPIKDERSVYVAMHEFKKEFNVSCLTISQDSKSIVLCFPGELNNQHIDFFIKRDVEPNQL